MKNDIITRAKVWVDTIRQWRGNNCKDALIIGELLIEIEHLNRVNKEHYQTIRQEKAKVVRLKKDLRSRARYLAEVEAQRDHAEADAERLARAMKLAAHVLKVKQPDKLDDARSLLVQALAAHTQRVIAKEGV